ncbi:MAG: SH3 domain-containing protein [Spirochaetales bacterium]|nr:SH3 domain-containing protein [Spirochaetales bacterium]
MRASADAAGEIIVVIPTSSEVLVIEESGNDISIGGKKGKWTKVRFEGHSGWVFGGFLSLAPKPTWSLKGAKLEEVDFDNCESAGIRNVLHFEDETRVKYSSDPNWSESHEILGKYQQNGSNTIKIRWTSETLYQATSDYERKPYLTRAAFPDMVSLTRCDCGDTLAICGERGSSFGRFKKMGRTRQS